MKSLLAATVLLSSLAANAFWAQADIRVSPGRVTATVANDTPYTLYCTGQVFGMYPNGVWVEAHINNAPIYPGNYGNLYAYPGYGFYFVRGDAKLWCVN